MGCTMLPAAILAVGSAALMKAVHVVIGARVPFGAHVVHGVAVRFVADQPRCARLLGNRIEQCASGGRSGIANLNTAVQDGFDVDGLYVLERGQCGCTARSPIPVPPGVEIGGPAAVQHIGHSSGPPEPEPPVGVAELLRLQIGSGDGCVCPERDGDSDKYGDDEDACARYAIH